jgi:hypothetical protein
MDEERWMKKETLASNALIPLLRCDIQHLLRDQAIRRIDADDSDGRIRGSPCLSDVKIDLRSMTKAEI